MKKIRILHIIHWPRSGIVNLVYNQITQSKNPSIKYKVAFFIEHKSTTSSFKDRGIEVTNYNYRPPYFLTCLIRVIKDIRATNPHIVHTHSFLPGIFVRTLYPFFRSFKMISTIHNSYPYVTNNNLKDKIKTFWEINSINYTKPIIIAVSHYVKRFLIEHTKINISLIKIIHNGIKIEANRHDNSFFPNHLKKAISVGRLDKQKRHDRLLFIWKRVVEEIPDADLDIVGEGSEKRNLIRMVKELELVENVNFLGFREDVPELLRDSNVFVLTSDHEGFPLVIMESLLQKRPVIAFDIGPLGEIIDDSCGILIKPFDVDLFAQKVKLLLSNTSFTKKLGLKGHKKVRDNFNIARMLIQIEDTYAQILAA